MIVDLLKLFICSTLKTPCQMQESRRCLVHYVELQLILSQISFPLQLGSVRVKFDWQHSLAHPRTPPYINAKISQISLTEAELQPILSQILSPWQRGSVGGKSDWQHLVAHPRKTSYRRKNLADIFYTDRVMVNFVPNFVAMVTEVGRGKCDWQHSMAHPRKPPINAKISQIFLIQAELQPILSQISLPWQPGRVWSKFK